MGLQTYLEYMVNLLAPKLKQLLDPLATISYELTETDFSDREINDPFIQNFLIQLDALLQPYKVLTNFFFEFNQSSFFVSRIL